MNVAPDILTRNYWLLKLAVSDKAHPKIIARLRKLYEARLFLEFGTKAPAPENWVLIKKMKKARKKTITPIKEEFPNF